MLLGALVFFGATGLAVEIEDRQCWDCHKAGQTADNAPAVAPNAYAESVHGANSCTSCHIHIRSLPHPPKLKAVLCATCHDSAEETFQSSLHGHALRRGLKRAPNCATCHGAHEITRCTEEDGATRHASLTARCRTCHHGPEAHWPVRAVRIHVAAGTGTPQPTVVRWVSRFYVALITVVVGLMLVHNLLDLLRKLRRGTQTAPAATELRLTGWMRAQHWVLMVLFAVLAYTGFARRATEAWWTAPLRGWGADETVIWRWHHAAGLSFVGLYLVHLATTLGTRAGREHLRQLRPKRQDWQDLAAAFRYNLGRGPAPAPRRWSYVEKIEYWSVLVGAFITSATGLAMLGGETLLRVVGLVGCELAWTIHYYEACLAVLSVLVWHGYAVILNPEVFPMNPAWLTGRRLTRCGNDATGAHGQ